MSAELVMSIYNQYKDSFPATGATIHNVLWQLLVNKAVYKGKRVVFTAIPNGAVNKLAIVIEGEKGYVDLSINFLTVDFEEASEIAEQMNMKVFGIDRREGMKIILSSM